MNTRTCKAKGRRLQNKVAKDLNNKLFYDYGSVESDWKPKEGDIKPAIMGESGRDIILSPKAEEWIPFDIECKNCETWSVPKWWKQAVVNAKEGRKPLLVMKKNRHEELVVMRWKDLLELL